MPTEYDLSRAFRAIEEELISSMVRNLRRHQAEEAAEGYRWSQWQAEQLRSLEAYKRRNRRRYGAQFHDLNRQIEALLHAAYQDGSTAQEREILAAIARGAALSRTADGAEGAFFLLNRRKLDALVQATVQDMEGAETAVLRRADDQYRKVIYNAQVYANTGAGTYRQAVDMATRDYLSAGVQCVVYRDGSRRTLSDYADMAIRTAAKRAYLQGEGTRRQEWGIHTVIINKRNGACPRCARFCGKVFVDDVWSGGTREEARAGGYPLLSSAIAEGLYHPRCKDGHTTWFHGVSGQPSPWNPREMARLEQAEEREHRASYARRQEERYDRLARYSLDGENRRRYQKLADEWAAQAEQGKRGAPETMTAGVVHTPEYRRRIDRLGETTPISREIWKQAVGILEHRSGTSFEDLVYVDSRTGKSLSRTDYNVAGQCVPSRAMRRMIRELEPETVIVIHNHPHSGVPSLADLRAAQSGKYRYGVIVCHDGKVFRYSVKEDANFPLADSLLDSLQKTFYTQDVRKRQKCLDALESCGVKLEVFP